MVKNMDDINEVLDEIIDEIKEQYGDGDIGCYVKGEWLSASAIISIIESFKK